MPLNAELGRALITLSCASWLQPTPGYVSSRDGELGHRWLSVDVGQIT